MGLIIIRCPRTGQDASSGIQTDQASFDAMPEVRSTMICPCCGAMHIWSKKWALLTDENDINGLEQHPQMPSASAQPEPSPTSTSI